MLVHDTQSATPDTRSPDRRRHPAAGRRSRAEWWKGIGLALGFALPIPVSLLSVVVLAQIPEAPTTVWEKAAVRLDVSHTDLMSGQRMYRSSCAVCHGPGGEGVHSLGKPLRNSAFVQEQSDEQLFALIIDGRKPGDPLNTTGALMPARGAQNLDDDVVNSIIVYLRALQQPGVEPVSMEPWNIKGREDGGGVGAAIELTDHPGYDLFVASCAACHGQGGEGIEGLGLPMTTSGFIRGTNDSDLITFIKSGRPIWDTNNSTGLDMPPKGGNPAITDEQLQTIVDYIRALQEEAMGS